MPLLMHRVQSSDSKKIDGSCIWSLAKYQDGVKNSAVNYTVEDVISGKLLKLRFSLQTFHKCWIILVYFFELRSPRVGGRPNDSHVKHMLKLGFSDHEAVGWQAASTGVHWSTSRGEVMLNSVLDGRSSRIRTSDVGRRRENVQNRIGDSSQVD